jgi:hypothetical protein
MNKLRISHQLEDRRHASILSRHCRMTPFLRTMIMFMQGRLARPYVIVNSEIHEIKKHSDGRRRLFLTMDRSCVVSFLIVGGSFNVGVKSMSLK